jgi:hypothetical protein
MPDQLFTYYIEISLVIIIIKSWSWGKGIVYLATGRNLGRTFTGSKVMLKVGTERAKGLLGVMALVCVYVYFHCCSGGCLCQ